MAEARVTRIDRPGVQGRSPAIQTVCSAKRWIVLSALVALSCKALDWGVSNKPLVRAQRLRLR